jgi:F420-dependent methylenetetrahydromethanopterin dehydrogenase
MQQPITLASGSTLTPFELAAFNALVLADGLGYAAAMQSMMEVMEGLDMQIDTARANDNNELAEQIEKTQTLVLSGHIAGYAYES